MSSDVDTSDTDKSVLTSESTGFVVGKELKDLFFKDSNRES